MRVLLALVCLAGVLRAEILYKVRLSGSESGKVVQLPAEEYVAAVLAGEAGNFHNDEALKAMAVAARTYAAYFRSRHAAEGFDFCATTHCQRAILKEAGGRFRKAAEATRGELLWFHSEPALAVYTQNCGGKIEAAHAVWPSEQAPYLAVHADPYCLGSGRAAWSWEVSTEKLRQALASAGMQAPAELRQVVVLQRTASGRVRLLSLAGAGRAKLISATSFRFAIGRTLGWNTLRSDQYTVESANGQVRFQGRGDGHGVGLCQDGADEMAAQGKSYREILSFYYPGTTVSVLANDVSWTSVPSDPVKLFAGSQSVALQAARIAKEVLSGLKTQDGLVLPPGVAIYIYPDMESYRNGTGEPGWVAAHTIGGRIETQPFDVLQQHGGVRPVIRHELLHAMVEGIARPGTPLWFREGLVECLAGDRLNVAADYLTQRKDEQNARGAHNSAAQRVAELKARYGMAELLRWMKDGIPADVTFSSTSSRPANRK
jgi:stage II sporulation protein D